MKQTFLPILLVCGMLAAQTGCVTRAPETKEARLIETLRSAKSSPKEKAEACAELKRAGTKSSVKALAALLTDEKLSHSARYVLESMPGPEAENALLKALPKTSGKIQAGIINSLAMRGEPAAVPALGRLLSASDENIAAASAEALGRIGGPKALGLLQKAASISTPVVHRAEVDGILTCANRMLDAGDQTNALKIFERVYDSEKSETIRVAAFRGVIMASGKEGIAKLTDAIVNGDLPIQAAALQTASQIKDRDLTKSLAELLPKTPVPVQLSLLQSLSQRGDPDSGPAVEKEVASSDAEVRTAALAALGVLGDYSTVELLAEAAASGKGAERNAARESLLEINRGAVTQRMLKLLKTVSPPAKTELLRALGGRGDQSAVPDLLDLAQNGGEALRAPALQALGLLADATQIPGMVQLVADARSDELRSVAADALSAVFDRVQSPGVKLDVSAFVTAVATGGMDTRLALLPVCSEVAQEPVRAILRSAAVDADERIREGAIHALCETRDAELLPDLLKFACDTNQAGSRLPAIRGCVHLATQDESVKLSTPAKLEVLTAILNTPLNTQEKRQVLSGLGELADEKSLALALQMLDDSEVKPEAEQAVVKIAGNISAETPTPARAALKRVIAKTTDADMRKAAGAALKKIK